ncbi:MAG: acetoacetate--CoA ligase [Acidimicrobiia bacterium]
MSAILWEPSPERANSTHLAGFMKRHGFDDYDDLWRWSIEDRPAFWQAVWDDGNVIASVLPDRAVGVEAMPGTEWFPGARLNFAENLLRRRDDGVAVITVDEAGVRKDTTWSGLNALVARAQAGLLSLGVVPGDRVAALVPNGLEALVAMLATTATGAVWSSCSPDFGPTGVIDRFGQIEPKVFITIDGYRYNGSVHLVGPTARAAIDAIPNLGAVVTIDQVGTGVETGDTLSLPWEEFTAAGPDLPAFAQLPFDQPAFILYSSGTTGPPKSIVHSAGGVLLKHLTELRLHSDIRRDDRVFWFTTCGWMMWNWLISALAAEATVVLYDGSPTHPDLGTLWRMAADTGVTHFGTSPKFLAANANAALIPKTEADLSSIRWLGSTGAPLNPEQFDWVYENVGDDLQLASVSGGTDIVGCFALGVPTLPVRRGELQARALGCAVEAWNEAGESVVGQTGELVCTAPFPSMPVSFWRDPQGDRYRHAYFDEHPGVWTHGDFIEIRPEGGVVIYGRSDTTLNPGGVRIGTAEIYRAIETMPEIEDSIVVGRDTEGDVEVLLFVVLAPGTNLDDGLQDAIKSRIRHETSPRHVPRHIARVSAIPYTLSGKKVEKAVRAIVNGEEVTNRDALADPEVLEEFTNAI